MHYLEHVHLKGGNFVPICFRSTPRIGEWDQTEFIIRISHLRSAGVFSGAEVISFKINKVKQSNIH